VEWSRGRDRGEETQREREEVRSRQETDKRNPLGRQHWGCISFQTNHKYFRLDSVSKAV
jgi:hypothetical protein